MSVHMGKAVARGLGALSLLSMVSVAAYGQEPDPKRTLVLGDIVVTGERVDRSVSDTASSVVVITGEDIEKDTSSASVKEIISNVPNVYMPGTVGAPTIRGQATEGPNYGAGAFYSGTVPRASISVDGRSLSFNEFYFGSEGLWDVESIEVFRGPQTTSQGPNSIAGAIIVNTKDPTFTTEGAGQVRYGSRNARQISAAVSGPVVGDELAARLALDYYARDTFVDFTNPSFDAGTADPDISNKTGRLKLLWQPSRIPDLEAKLTYSHHESNGPQAESVNSPFDDLDNTATAVVSWPISSDAVIADIAYDVNDGVTVTNQTQYSKADVERLYNPMSFGSASIDQEDAANETRVNFDALQGRLSGVAGLFLRRVESHDYLNFLGDTEFDDTKDSVGLFSELTYDLTERWSVTGGVRYQRDSVERNGTSDSVPGAYLDYDETFDAVLPKVSLAYHATPDVTVGALVNKGYNPGGVSLSFTRSEFIPFDEETVWNYELFGRADFLDRRLSLTTNVFFSDYSDAQRNVATVLEGGLVESVVVNAEEARAYGLEVGASFQATDALRIFGSTGLLKTEITKFTSAIADYEGKEFENAPEYSLTLGVDWNVTDEVNVSANVRHVGGYFSDDENSADYEIDPYTVANLRVGYRPLGQFDGVGGHLEVFGYVNNIFDDTSPTFISASRGTSGQSANVVEPREIGAGLKITF